MTKFMRPILEIEGLVAANELSPLIACSLDMDDRGLMSTFVECWHKETNSFHLPVGEVTITLDDVALLLHAKIEACHWIVVARAYLLHLLGCTLFSNKSVTYVHVVILGCTV